MYYEIGKILGKFHRLTADFDATKLEMTIPNFHSTFEHYQKCLEANEQCKSDKYLYTWMNINLC